jgi:hypothetical protein
MKMIKFEVNMSASNSYQIAQNQPNVDLVALHYSANEIKMSLTDEKITKRVKELNPKLGNAPKISKIRPQHPCELPAPKDKEYILELLRQKKEQESNDDIEQEKFIREYPK